MQSKMHCFGEKETAKSTEDGVEKKDLDPESHNTVTGGKRNEKGSSVNIVMGMTWGDGK